MNNGTTFVADPPAIVADEELDDDVAEIFDVFSSAIDKMDGLGPGRRQPRRIRRNHREHNTDTKEILRDMMEAVDNDEGRCEIAETHPSASDDQKHIMLDDFPSFVQDVNFGDDDIAPAGLSVSSFTGRDRRTAPRRKRRTRGRCRNRDLGTIEPGTAPRRRCVSPDHNLRQVLNDIARDCYSSSSEEGESDYELTETERDDRATLLRMMSKLSTKPLPPPPSKQVERQSTISTVDTANSNNDSARSLGMSSESGSSSFADRSNDGTSRSVEHADGWNALASLINEEMNV